MREDAAPPDWLDAPDREFMSGEAPEWAHDFRLEQDLLGGLLMRPEQLDRLAALRPVHMAEPIHAHMLELMRKARDRSELFSIVTLRRPLEDRFADTFRDAGLTTGQYLAKLQLACIDTRPEYQITLARRLIELHGQRQLQALGPEAASMVATDLGATLARLEADIAAIRKDQAALAGRDNSLGAALREAFGEIDAAYKNEGIVGLRTGFNALDKCLGGIEATDLCIVAGRTSMGKAQPVDAPVLMRDGSWRPIGSLRFGDELASVDGAPSRVAAVHDRGDLSIFRVTFSDGRTVEACGQHLWTVTKAEWGAPRTISTAVLASMLTRYRHKRRVMVALPSGHFGHSADLPIDPYVLGCLIGDGCLTTNMPKFTSADPEIATQIQDRLGASVDVRRVAGSYAWSIVTRGVAGRPVVPAKHKGEFKTDYQLTNGLRALGLMGKSSTEKFIPPVYLAANRQARLDLLRGLMDTDGWAEMHGSVRFSSCSKALASGVCELVRSLGGLCSVVEKKTTFTHKGERRHGLIAYVCRIRREKADELFSLERKKARARTKSARKPRLTVKSVVSIGEMPARCITVTHPTGLYVAEGYTPTHNSSFARGVCLNIAKAGGRVLMFSLEMSRAQMAKALVSMETGISAHRLRTGEISRQEFERALDAERRLRELPLLIDDRSGISVAEMRATAERHAEDGALALIVGDYLQIVGTPERRRGSNRAEEVGEIATGLKDVAKRLKAPVMALAQLSRETEKQEDKRPSLANLKESGSIEEAADSVVLLHRDEYYLSRQEPDSKDADKWSKWRTKMDAAKGKADAIVAKNRHGPADTCKLAWHGATMSFGDLDGPPDSQQGDML